MGKALRLIIAWQLENPDNLNPEAAIAESREKIRGLIQDEKQSRPSNAKSNGSNHEGNKKNKEKRDKK